MSGDCWPWTGAANGRYGTVKSAGRPLLTHRVAWELTHGPIPAGIQVCHKCDNPICVRPTHLFLGTQRDNIADMDRKGRRPKPSPERIAALPRGEAWRQRHPRQAQGERVGGSKLTADKVREIRRLRSEGWTLERLADEFGVRIGTIRFIVTRQTWKHIGN